MGGTKSSGGGTGRSKDSLWEEAKAIGAAEDLVGDITNFEQVLGEEPWRRASCLATR